MIQMSLLVGQEQRYRCREWTSGYRGWGMNREIGTEVCALPRVEQIASGNLLDNSGSSAVFCGDLDGWDQEGVRGRSKREGMCPHIANFLCYTIL